jgi:hypothetical protein
MTLTESPDHHSSHRDLLRELSDSHAGKIQAIMVPTIRNPRHLRTSQSLALTLGCALVTLHSGKWTSAAAAMASAPRGVPHVAIDVPEQSELRLIEFQTSRLMTGPFARRKDTSAKRNLGLLLAHVLGWQRIVFLDDDIDVPEPTDLRRAAGLLDSYNAVGLHIAGFPDNSVVCHAYRAIGGGQQSFIGGGALAVETTRSHSFFPDIYNEDWFYLLDLDKGLQPLAATGKVVQQPYDPFRDDERARREEVGDVLGEGIFWLLDQGRQLDEANIKHWEDFLPRRRRFIEYILSQTDRAQVGSAERARMESALKASLGRLALIEPEWCERYVRAWMVDRSAWDRHIRDLHPVPSLDEALKLLSSKGRRPLNYVTREIGDIPERRTDATEGSSMRMPFQGISPFHLNVPVQ